MPFRCPNCQHDNPDACSRAEQLAVDGPFQEVDQPGDNGQNTDAQQPGAGNSKLRGDALRTMLLIDKNPVPYLDERFPGRFGNPHKP